MKFFRNISRLILLLALPLLAGGCSDVDFGNIWSDSEEGNVTVVLPSFTAFTRAGSTELNISTLYFFAFPQDGEGELFVEDLADGSAMTVVDSYNRYTLDLKPGKYKFYIAANYFNTEDNLNSITEDELIAEEKSKVKKIVYNIDFDGSKPEAGLPMSCDHTGFKASKDGGYFTDSYEIGSENTTLYADMVFDVAKVSLTLNDGLGEPLEIKGIKAENFSAKVPLFKQDFSDYGLFNPTAISLDRKGANCVEEIPSVGDGSQTVAETEGDGNSVSSLDLSRYHGETVTFYVPERIVTDPVANQSKLKITAGGEEYVGGEEISLLLGDDGRTDSNDTALPEESARTNIDRGVHYSYTINVKGEITLAVQPWTPVSILYNLHGPVFLHVEKTVIPAAAGESTTFWYDSNAKPVEIDEKYSPVYTVGGEEVPFYILDNTTYPDSLIVSVNPLISPQQLTDEERERYNYFHLKAGNLRKKIDVIPLKLEPFLHVDPLVMTIDARERIASGVYEGYLDINVTTNLKEIIVNRVSGDWNMADGEKALCLTDSLGNEISDGAEIKVERSKVVLKLKYAGINSGWNFWKSKHQLTLTVSAPTDDDNVLTETVTVNIVNNIQNYTIHFRPPTGWAHPHIYVYQCLEFPGDLGVYEGKDYKTYRNKPVGADTRGNTAALEYSFTGKIAFKGWYVGEANNPYRSTLWANGFYYFEEDIVNLSSGSTSWAPGSTGFTTHYYDNMDFCSDHREYLKSRGDNASDGCPYCVLETLPIYGNNNVLTTGGYNNLWPGIQMKDEGDGWWQFELTGIATPGKALIMFADGHNYTREDGYANDRQVNNRFPKIREDGSNLADPGIPLFDYPDKEGWFDYALGSTKFVSSKPSIATVNVKYRIYWSKVYRDYIQYNEKGGANYGKVQNIGSETINGVERYYYDLVLPTIDSERLVTACKSDGTESNPTNWKSIQSNRVMVENKPYHYYMILY